MGWMAVALASFILVAISGREAGRVLSTIDMMFYRGIISLTILLIAIRLAGIPFAQFRSNRLGLHTLRGVVHFGAQAAWLHALILIPLTELFTFEFTAPLWVAILAPLLLGEVLTRTRTAAALLGFLGVLVIAQPGISDVTFGTLLALGSAVGFGVSIVVGKLLLRTDAPVSVLLHMISIQTILGCLAVLPGPALPDAVTAGWLLVLGLFGLTAHFGLVRAFAHADAMVVAPLDFLRLPLIALVGVTIYQEPLEWAVMIGAGIVVAANLLNLSGERRTAAVRHTHG
jgi:drug/metabolite transporter (DMT)-like permease